MPPLYVPISSVVRFRPLRPRISRAEMLDRVLQRGRLRQDGKWHWQHSEIDIKDEKIKSYSVWLCMPQSELHALLQEEIRLATSRYGCAGFPPHMSISADIETTVADAIHKTLKVARSIQV